MYFFFILALFLCSHNISGEEWTRILGPDHSNGYGCGITVDSLRQVYVTGVGYVSFDGEINSGLSDIVLANYDASGSKQLTRFLGSSTYDIGRGIAIDSFSSKYIVGSTRGSLDGQPANGWSLVIAKYNYINVKQWIRQLKSSDTYGYGIAVDKLSNVYVVGEILGSLDGQPAYGNIDIVIAKYNIDGIYQWVRILGSSNNDQGFGIAIDSSNSAYITGYASGSLDSQTYYGGTSDIIIAKYSSAGTKLWVRILGSSSYDVGYGIAVDSVDHAYITGYSGGNMDSQNNNGNSDIVIAKYNSNGEKQWVRFLGSSNNDVGYGIAVDSSNNAYITGTASASIDGQRHNGYDDIVVAKYNSAGTKQWVRMNGTSVNDYGQSITISADASTIFVTGSNDNSFVIIAMNSQTPTPTPTPTPTNAPTYVLPPSSSNSNSNFIEENLPITIGASVGVLIIIISVITIYIYKRRKQQQTEVIILCYIIQIYYLKDLINK
jgi:hypothetical protein